MHKKVTTRTEMYLWLKEAAPHLAIGKTRARREELEQLISSVTDTEASKPALKKPVRKRRVLRRRTEVPSLQVPQGAIERMRHGIEMLDLVANTIKMSGLSETQIGTLLYIVHGLDAEASGKAVAGLIGLKDALMPLREQVA